MALLPFTYDLLLNRDFFNMAIIGKTSCGKTTFVREILKKCRNRYDKIFLFNDNEQSASQYYNYVYKQHIFLVKGNFTDQLSKIAKWSGSLKETHKRTLIIFDDLGEGTRKIENFTNTSRHSNIDTIFLIHKITFLNTATRPSIHFFALMTPASIVGEVAKNITDSQERIKTINSTVSKFAESAVGREHKIILDDENGIYHLELTITPEINGYLFGTISKDLLMLLEFLKRYPIKKKRQEFEALLPVETRANHSVTNLWRSEVR